MEFASSTLISGVATALGANVTAGTSNLWPIMLIIVGIPLTFYVINKIIGLFTKHARA
ncbi:MAG: hypothetical protein WC389_17270 [Lutibacter sp.]|jgi:hypothetical protein